MQKEHIYRGKVNPGGGVEVTVDGEHSLDFFLDMLPESDEMPARFSWGTGVSGRDRLAFALLFHASKNKKTADNWYESFSAEKIRKLDRHNSWEMSSQCINDWGQKKADELQKKRDEEIAKELSNFEKVKS